MLGWWWTGCAELKRGVLSLQNNGLGRTLPGCVNGHCLAAWASFPSRATGFLAGRDTAMLHGWTLHGCPFPPELQAFQLGETLPCCVDGICLAARVPVPPRKMDFLGWERDRMSFPSGRTSFLSWERQALCNVLSLQNFDLCAVKETAWLCGFPIPVEQQERNCIAKNNCQVMRRL